MAGRQPDLQRRWAGVPIYISFHLVLDNFILLAGRDYYVRSVTVVSSTKFDDG